jgi:plastocyanin
MSCDWKALLAGGLVVAGIIPAAASADPDFTNARQVNIELSNFDFTPKTLTLQAGKPYRLHLTNTGSGGHNFSSPAFFRAATIAPEDATAVVKGGIDLKKGETRDVRVIPTKGQYKLKCTHFMHTAFGMKGKIIVD